VKAKVAGLLLSGFLSLWQHDVRSILRPTKRMTAREWIPQHVRLPASISPFPGLWAGNTFAYLGAPGGPIEAWDDESIERVTLKWATQTAKSTLIAAFIAYSADQDPAPAMVADANQEGASELFLTRIYPTLEECRRTAPLLLPKRDRRNLLVDLQDMYVYAAWSGSVTRLGAKAVRYLYETELDKWSRATTLEADPGELARERTKAYPNRKILEEGTPTLKGLSRIEDAYMAGDRRRYHVPCPHCGEYQVLKFDQLKWPHKEDGHSCSAEEAHDLTWYECEHCAQRIEDIHKPGMLARGRWCREGERVTREGEVVGEPVHPGRRASFHLTSLYSPALRFGEVAAAWLEAQNSPGSLQNFVNGWLAEVWEARSESEDWVEVGKRLRSDLPEGSVPDDALLLVAGVDVGLYDLHYVVRAWAPHMTSYLVRHGRVERDEEQTAAQMLDEVPALVLDRSFPRLSGGEPMEVRYCGIDARYQTDDVYALAKAVGSRLRAVLGQGSDRVRGRYRMVRVDISPRTGKPIPGGLSRWNVDSAYYKEAIYDRLQIPAGQPGAWNLHREVTEDYLRQLCGEVQQREFDKYGQERYVWTVVDTEIGNHYLDAEVYALAMADMLRVRDLREGQQVAGQQGKGQPRPPQPSWLRPRRSGSWLGRR